MLIQINLLLRLLMNVIAAKKLNSWKSNELNITTHIKTATTKQPAVSSVVHGIVRMS